MRKASKKAKPRPTKSNPDALYLPSADTATLCRRHREESEVIPLGRERGWPSEGEINFKKVAERVKAVECTQVLMKVILGQLESPYKDEAFAEWGSKGRIGMRGIMSQCEHVY